MRLLQTVDLAQAMQSFVHVSRQSSSTMPGGCSIGRVPRRRPPGLALELPLHQPDLERVRARGRALAICDRQLRTEAFALEQGAMQ
jgi:hypothetical protein